MSEKPKLLRKILKSPRLVNIFLSRLGLGYLAYQIEFRCLRFLSGFSWFQKLFLKNRRQNLKRLLEETGLKGDHEIDRFVQDNWLAEMVFLWWFHALEKMPEGQFNRLVAARGWDAIDAAASQGRGVLLLFHHTTLSHLPWFLLHRKVDREKTTTIGKEWSEGAKPRSESEAAAALKFDFIKQLKKSVSLLKAGGFVRIAADGFRGDSDGVLKPFFGRQREFRPSFAQLALMTDALVLPVSVGLHRDGRMSIDVLDSLSMTGTTNEERAASLVDGYVDFVRNEWMSDRLAFVSYSIVPKYLNLPHSHEQKMT